MEIRTSVENRRGCGYRSPGGLYLMGGYPVEPCHRLPFELSVCPACGQGIKPARGWTWIDGVELFAPGCEQVISEHDAKTDLRVGVSTHCIICVVCAPSQLVPQKEFKPNEEPPEHFGMSGLIWIGEKFYPTPETFIDEATAMGVSRRIKVVPNGFVLGETWVFFAHRFTVEDEDNPAVEKRHPGIFRAFMPTSIEYIIKGDETEKELEDMEKRGISLVKVVHKDINMDLPLEDEKISNDLFLRGFLPSGLEKTLDWAGYNLLSQIRDMPIDELIKIKGIGLKTANMIVEKIATYYADNPERQ